MKIKTTKKDILNNTSHVIKIGYCNAQYLLYGLSPIAYTSGSCGWCSDIYILKNDIVVSTGYAPFGDCVPDYDTLKSLENKAKTLVLTYAHSDMPFSTFQSNLKLLREDLLKSLKLTP